MEIVESSSSSSVVPPGFRFHPTEEELVGYYLNRKINSLEIDLDVIIHIDLYRIEPWDIQESCKLGYDEEQKEWYFFSHKDRKYPTGTRTNRATAAGFWKATGRDKAVLSKDNKLIGMRKTLVYYNGRAPSGRKSDWIMHEYRLHTSEHQPPQEEGWVVCRAFKKPSPIGHQKQGGWNNAMDSSYYYGRSDYHDIINQQQQPPLLPSNIIYDQDQMVHLIPNLHDRSPSISMSTGFASTNDDDIVDRDLIHDEDHHNHQRDFLVYNGDHNYEQWKSSFDHKQLLDDSDQVIASRGYSTFAQYPNTPLIDHPHKLL